MEKTKKNTTVWWIVFLASTAALVWAIDAILKAKSIKERMVSDDRYLPRAALPAAPLRSTRNLE